MSTFPESASNEPLRRHRKRVHHRHKQVNTEGSLNTGTEAQHPGPAWVTGKLGGTTDELTGLSGENRK